MTSYTLLLASLFSTGTPPTCLFSLLSKAYTFYLYSAPTTTNPFLPPVDTVDTCDSGLALIMLFSYSHISIVSCFSSS